MERQWINARDLRNRATDCERLLWQYLRFRRLAGYKFRRQLPIGPHIVDFACMERRLAIELDGGQHVEQVESDKRRTNYLQTRGYHVLRFWNHEVIESPELVVDAILIHLQCTPPQPSPAQQGRE